VGHHEPNVWRDEAMAQRSHSEEQRAAMEAFAILFEQHVEGVGDEALFCLAFHHLAMMSGSYAKKKTLKRAMKSGIRQLSEAAPAIFPRDRVPRTTKR
jgi:hypothetical protein